MPGSIRTPELARRAQAKLPDLAVLFTSGYTNAIVHGGRLDPGVALLGKPYTDDALARKVRHVLANQALRNFARHDHLSSGPLPVSNSGVAALSVLYVEDDDVIRASTGELLPALGHRVTVCSAAEDAVGRLGDCDYDVLVTDFQLNGMSGGELARKVRERAPAIGIVFATGAGRVPAGEWHGRRAPALLAKPYDLAGIERALAEATR